MYKALYRKWRPVGFDDVVGQEHVVTTLKNEILHAKLAHAYLFTGSRGTGKTTCAKILAKAINCTSPVNGEPCLECDICKGIDSDSMTDIVEIDAASNRGIDSVRDLIEETRFTPVECRYRVYIIDEVHMLTTEAFNALLKTIEEPPEYVMFILATTDINKVPQTIISRCQRFDFRRISPDDIRDRILYIAEKEQIKINSDAAARIARISDGGMRDALSLLDKCSSLSDDITEQTVTDAAGCAGNESLFEIAGAIAREDAPGAFEIIDKLYSQSVSVKNLTGELIMFYRNLMLMRVNGADTPLADVMAHERQAYSELCGKYSLSAILHILSALNLLNFAVSKSVSPRSELEMCVLRLVKPELDISLEAVLRRIDKLETRLNSGAETLSQVQTEPVVEALVPQCSEKTVKIEREPVPDPSVTVFESWEQVLSELETKNPPLAGALAGSTAYVSGNRILIDAVSELFLTMMRTQETARNSIRGILFELTGKNYGLGPYKKPAPKVSLDALSTIEERARALNINVEKK